MPYRRFPKPYADAVARLRVPGGFLLVAAFLWLSDPTLLSLWCGLPIAVLGLWLRGWAAGHVTKDSSLTTSGPYAYVRNPLYLGTLTAAAGIVIAARKASLALLFAAFFGCIYLPVIQLEEQHLRELFPDFGAYAADVPALVPRRKRKGGGKRFQWRLYIRNREYQAVAAFLLGAAVLIWKAQR